jgi:peptide chain release factor 1
MLEKLDAIRARFDELGVALTNPEIIADNKKFGGLSKEYRSLEKIVQSHNQYLKILDDVEFYKEALNGTDEEMRELAKQNYPKLKRSRKEWKPISGRC